jgi:hypothetical protein
MNKIDDMKMLSGTSKMPCKSISRSAYLCNVGMKLRKIKGSTCHNCYACKGMYNMPNVKNAMERREEFFDAIDFVPRMARLIMRLRPVEFRWFDSGDVRDVKMCNDILDVCEATPSKIHWIPSREYKIWRDVLKTRDLPDNVTLRMSAHMIDGAPSQGWQNTSTVASNDDNVQGWSCPAPLQGGKCADCRACWDRSVANVTYHQH